MEFSDKHTLALHSTEAHPVDAKLMCARKPLVGPLSLVSPQVSSLFGGIPYNVISEAPFKQGAFIG